MAFPNISTIGNLVLDEIRAYSDAPDKGQYIEDRAGFLFDHYIPDDIQLIPNWIEPVFKRLLRGSVIQAVCTLHDVLLSRQAKTGELPEYPSAMATTETTDGD